MNTDALFRSVEFESVSACNRKCSFCPVAYDDSPKEIMPNEVFDKAINELKELGFKGPICFSGYGEPLLDKRLEEFVARIKGELGSPVEVTTHGDFLTYERFSRLVSAGADAFRLSQHDKEPSEQIIAFFKSTQQEDLRRIIFQVVNEETYALVNRGGSVEGLNTPYPIGCAPMHLIIRANGGVPLCCNDYYQEVTFGNIKEQRLIDIWNSSFYRKTRAQLKRGVFNLKICKKCLGIA